MAASPDFSKMPEVVRARAYPPDHDFWVWWEVLKIHTHDRAGMGQSARNAVLHVTEKVKEAKTGPAGRRVSIIEAQWWFCQEVSLSLYNQGAIKFRFAEAVPMPEPHRRSRKYATLYRLERAGDFERADDMADILAAGWDAAALGAEPRDDAHATRGALGGGCGGLTLRELRGVLDDIVFRGAGLALARLERALAQGRQPPGPLVREHDAMAGLLRLRGAALSNQANALIDAPPAPLCLGQGSEHQTGASWETWDD